MKYYLKTIRSEDDRTNGVSYKYGPYTTIQECIIDAERLHTNGYLYTEVSNDNDEIYCEYEN